MKKFITSAEFKSGTKGAIEKVATVSAPQPGEAARTIKFIVSTRTPDRDSDVINQDGIDLTNYRRNPVVLAFHNSDTWPIGKCVSIGVEDGCLTAVVEFIDASVPEAGPIAECAYQLCLGGYLNATSIGFLPGDDWEWRDDDSGGALFKSCELLEFSIVPIPCNPNALIIPAAPAIESDGDINSEDENESKSLNNDNARARRMRIVRAL